MISSWSLMASQKQHLQLQDLQAGRAEYCWICRFLKIVIWNWQNCILSHAHFLQLRLSLLASLGHSLQLQKGTQMPLEPCSPLSSNYPASHIRIPVNKAEIAKGSAKFESFSSGPRDSDGQWEFPLHRLYINIWKVRTCLQYLAMSSRLCSMTERHPRPHQKIHKK